jgi:chromatin remodeling complex protein RSC6
MSNSSPRFLDSNLDYLVLWLTIISAVALGNLLSNFITASYAEAKAEQALKEASVVLRKQSEQAQRDIAQQQAANEEAQQAAQTQQREQRRAQRRQDANGQQLARACAEWTQANTAMRTYTTQSEMAKHCGRLDRYLDTGAVVMP